MASSGVFSSLAGEGGEEAERRKENT